MKRDAHNGELKSVLHASGNGYLPNWKTNLRRINSFACVFFMYKCLPEMSHIGLCNCRKSNSCGEVDYLN